MTVCPIVEKWAVIVQSKIWTRLVPDGYNISDNYGEKGVKPTESSPEKLVKTESKTRLTLVAVWTAGEQRGPI